MRKIDYKELLKDLGENPDQYGVVQFDTIIGRALYQYASALTDVLKSNLTEKDAYYSESELLQSIIALPVSMSGNNYLVTIQGNDYAFFVDKGVSGTQQKYPSPFSFKNEGVSPNFNKSLRKWITKRGIPLESRYSKTKNLTKQQRAKKQIDEKTKMAYAIGRSIKRKGLKPTLFITDAVTQQALDSMASGLANAI
ncbi:MAG: hypothetical protein EBS55_03025, partial [Flavobacteriaceae bacterium]|nr:hypothetical protein [Flavobacteriaceae bacterium]